MTRTPLSGSKGQRSWSPGRFTHRGVNASGSCSGERGNVLSVGTYCHVAVCRRGRLGGARRFGTHRGSRGAGAYCGGRPPTASYCCCCYCYISNLYIIYIVSILKKTCSIFRGQMRLLATGSQLQRYSVRFIKTIKVLLTRRRANDALDTMSYRCTSW